jgi:hypothetical protein
VLRSSDGHEEANWGFVALICNINYKPNGEALAFDGKRALWFSRGEE